MWLKILVISLIFYTTKADRTKDISTYLKDLDNTKLNNITTHINNVLKSLNLSDIEVNIILNSKENNTSESWENEKFLKQLFQTAISSDPLMIYNLREFVWATNNTQVYEIFYETLWLELKTNRNKKNPYLYIELYKDLQNVMENYISEKLKTLYNDIKNELITYSAQLLQSYFIQNSTIHKLLEELKPLNNLYDIIIPEIYENLNTIENPLEIAKGLLDFDNHTSKAVYNHISYIKYLQSQQQNIPQKLYDNLELLIARPDITNISLTQRKNYSQLLPKSLGNLLATQKICLRNITTNFYIFECPQTYLLCTNYIANNTNPLNRKIAAFNIKRIGNHQYTLKSPYWGRYFHLQNNTLKNRPITTLNNNSNSFLAQITKNLYSHVEESPWLIRFNGDYATIQDSLETSYVCGGNPTFWSNAERYTYTRPSKDFLQKHNECLWLLEDCSDVI